ncbi:MAG TPA: GNAT family N-acetyltransferase [Ktedonobacterales bacterium]
MPVTLRQITTDEVPDFVRATGVGFGFRSSEADIEAERGMMDASRSVAAVDGSRIVGTAMSFATELTLPGATRIAVAAVTSVTVAPTHRRQGILRQMMTRQLRECQERGEPVAILTASESGIYGRFGYGSATTVTTTEISTRHATLSTQTQPTGTLRLIELEEARESVFPPLFERIRLTQPGEIARSAGYWRTFIRPDGGPAGPGAGPQFFVAYYAADGALAGAVSYRFQANWDYQMPNSTIEVSDFLATTTEARVALWRYCLSVDLVARVKLWRRPVEDPLRWLLADPRRLRALALREFIFVRPLDVPVLLGSRHYATSGAIVLDVRDDFTPEMSGSYEVEATPDGASCRRTRARADIQLSMADLGSIALGGARLRTLAGADRVAELTPGAIARADVMFLSDPPPFCSSPF